MKKNNFGSWAYNKHSNYYLAKIIEEYNSMTRECIKRYYEALNPKFAYRDKKNLNI